MPSPDAPITLYVIIVLYKMEPEASATFLSLLRSLAEPVAHHLSYRILLYDNTPPAQVPSHLPDHVEYIASPANTGLADAYNVAAARARAGSFDWLLTLDQDTDLPLDFIPQLTQVAHACMAQHEIAAIVPHVSSGNRDVSPNWFAAGMLPRWFAKGYRGVPDKSVYAFNSGTLVRVSAVEAIGGYNPLFWLDNCDSYLYRQIEKRRWRVYVAGHIHLQHDFSMLDISNKMSLFRYQNALHAGSAFYDMEMSWLAGLDQTVRLLRRYTRQLLQAESPAVRNATLAMFFRRLFVSKARRIREWTDAQHRRIHENKVAILKSAKKYS